MDTCINHPDHAAIERCEVCGDPLCDLCLWYSEDGRRLCERHAKDYAQKGFEVQSPALYTEGIRVREAEDVVEKAPYQGNDHDLRAAAAALIGVASLSIWMGGVWCLPLVAFFLGLAGLSNARQALNPERARRMSVIAVIVSAASILPFILFYCMIFSGMLVSIILSAQGP